MSADTDMYNYAQQINPPHKVGIKDRGTWGQVGKNIKGLESYFQVLSKGGGPASKKSVSGISGGMGNRYFVKAVGKCKGGEDRHIYMDHIPTNRSAQSVIFDKEVGFVPGLTNNVMQALDPNNIINAVTNTSKVECANVSLTQVNSLGQNVPAESKWVSKFDAKGIDPCWFSDKKNTVTGEVCKPDGFANISDGHNMSQYASPVPPLSYPTDDAQMYAQMETPLDTMETIYIAMLSGVGLYTMYRLASTI